MDNERAKAWTAAFLLFSELWPRMDGTPSRIQVWDEALKDLSPDEIVTGASVLIATHTHGQPVPGNLRAAVRTKPAKVPIVATDVYGRKVLSRDGTPSISGWIELPEGDARTSVTDTEAMRIEETKRLSEHLLPEANN